MALQVSSQEELLVVSVSSAMSKVKKKIWKNGGGCQDAGADSFLKPPSVWHIRAGIKIG